MSTTGRPTPSESSSTTTPSTGCSAVRVHADARSRGGPRGDPQGPAAWRSADAGRLGLAGPQSLLRDHRDQPHPAWTHPAGRAPTGARPIQHGEPGARRGAASRRGFDEVRSEEVALRFALPDVDEYLSLIADTGVRSGSRCGDWRNPIARRSRQTSRTRSGASPPSTATSSRASPSARPRADATGTVSLTLACATLFVALDEPGNARRS